MRIARILTRLNLGGPARQVLASDPLLVERGHEVCVFVGKPCAGEGDLFATLVQRGVDVVRVPGLQRGLAPWRDARALMYLRGALAEYRPEILHTHASKAGTLGRWAARCCPEARRVHTFHGHVLSGYFPAWINRVLVAHEARLARQTERIVAVSHATARELLELEVVSREKLVVVPPGIDLAGLEASLVQGPGIREQLGAGSEDFVVGVVGRLAAVKQPLMALAVFETLARRYPQLHLVYIGDGDQRGSLERAVRKHPMSDRIHLLGARELIGPLLEGLDTVLLTSRSEGMPVALMEAGALGLPVVAMAVGGVEELVAHERTGFLGESVEELAFGLAQLLDGPTERANMGQRARVRVQAHHSATALTARLEALYQALLVEEHCAY